ncbi:MAG: hypothetical protein GX137_00190 [Thermoplasmatales archaeon]|nr:hypothetical protein [Thermoplasmatales archaeon]
MRRSFVLPAVCLLILSVSVLPFPCDASSDCLRLSCVIPVGDFEGVTITNYGNAPSDLSNVSICDGEGTVRFTTPVILAPGASLSVLRSDPDSWFPCGRYLTFTSPGISQSRFALADNGDQVYLERDGTVLDCLVYGNAEICEGWVGEPLQKIPRYRYAYRISAFDTDSSKDWSIGTGGILYVPPDSVHESSVIPFSFPDSVGAPVFDALRSAESEVCLCLYTLNHIGAAHILLELIGRGISVTVLAEGDPAGGISKSSLGVLSALEEGGADVRMMKKSDDGFRRYTYLHAKYAVVDGRTVIITSENWTESSFSSNRGWGAVVHSESCASVFRSVFESDSDLDNTDVVRFRDLYPAYAPVKVPPFSYDDVYAQEFRADAVPIFSPNSPEAAIERLISEAEIRAYSQQLRVQYSWAETLSGNPAAWMCQAAERGVDARLIIDVSFDDPSDEDTRDGYGVMEALRKTEVEVRCVKGGDDYSMTHNKGLIVDDSAWVGSINWTSTSFFQNREAAVILHSAEVADFYSGIFLSDWGPDIENVSLRASVKGRLVEGGVFVLSAEGSVVPEGTVFCWDIDSDGTFDREGMRIPVSFGAGMHVISVRAVFPDGSVLEESITVDVSEKDGQDLLIAAPLILIIVSLLVIKGLRAFRRS